MPSARDITFKLFCVNFLCHIESRPCFGPACVKCGVGKDLSHFLGCNPVLFRIFQMIAQRLSDEHHRLDLYAGRLGRGIPVRMERERFRLQLLQQKCEAADPVLLLKRGYSMTFCGGKLVRKASELKGGEEITTRLAEGEIRSVVQ